MMVAVDDDDALVNFFSSLWLQFAREEKLREDEEDENKVKKTKT